MNQNIIKGKINGDFFIVSPNALVLDEFSSLWFLLVKSTQYVMVIINAYTE